MNIRGYLSASVIISLLFIGTVSLIAYQRSTAIKKRNAAAMETQNGVSRLARVREDAVEIFTGGKWQNLEIRGIQLSSFYPGYERFRSNANKKEVLAWLGMIADLGANTVYVPYLQPPNFYAAINDYNTNRLYPLYVLQGVPIDSKQIIEFYNAGNQDRGRITEDMRDTVDAMHGAALVLDNKRRHSGVYLDDISAYVLGYIAGSETSVEAISLTNRRFPDKTGFKGSYYAVEGAAAFDCFIAETLDYICGYEIERYGIISLYSYISTPETDPLNHRNATKLTQNVQINMEKIKSLRREQNIIAAYIAHPNNPNFLDYEHTDNPVRLPEGEDSAYKTYLASLTGFHSKPVIITGAGIPASRGVSHVDLDDGYNRGGNNEQTQGSLIIRLLNDIKGAGCAGVTLQSFQDEWLNHSTFNTRDFTDPNSAPYWHDIQASDECFGLLEFIPEKKEQVCIDGDPEEWEGLSPLNEEPNMSVYARGGAACLYLMFNIPGLSLQRDEIFFAISVTPKSGAARWEEEEVDFPIPADFIIHFKGYNESRLVVHDRYNLFRYRFSYYSRIVDKQAEAPSAAVPAFSGIYMMNRFNVWLKASNTLAGPIYRQTGMLVYGTENPADADYNSLTDFAKTNDVLEIRLPWSLLNFRDPTSGKVQDDFYNIGLSGGIRIDNMSFALVIRPAKGNMLTTGAFSYKLPDIRDQKYRWRLRKSASMLKEYWGE